MKIPTPIPLMLATLLNFVEIVQVLYKKKNHQFITMIIKLFHVSTESKNLEVESSTRLDIFPFDDYLRSSNEVVTELGTVSILSNFTLIVL